MARAGRVAQAGAAATSKPARKRPSANPAPRRLTQQAARFTTRQLRRHPHREGDRTEFSARTGCQSVAKPRMIWYSRARETEEGRRSQAWAALSAERHPPNP